MSDDTNRCTNGIIRDFFIRLERGCILTAWLFIEHEDGGTQGFGGFVLGGLPTTAAGNHAQQPNLCADFLVGVLRAAGVDDEKDIRTCIGKAVRVRRGPKLNSDIVAIGHIIAGDRWYFPRARLDELKRGPASKPPKEQPE